VKAITAGEVRAALASVWGEWLKSAGYDAVSISNLLPFCVLTKFLLARDIISQKKDKDPAAGLDDAAILGTVFALAVFDKVYASKKAEWCVIASAFFSTEPCLRTNRCVLRFRRILADKARSALSKRLAKLVIDPHAGSVALNLSPPSQLTAGCIACRLARGTPFVRVDGASACAYCRLLRCSQTLKLAPCAARLRLSHFHQFFSPPSCSCFIISHLICVSVRPVIFATRPLSIAKMRLSSLLRTSQNKQNDHRITR
jgi:hypothetical protein